MMDLEFVAVVWCISSILCSVGVDCGRGKASCGIEEPQPTRTFRLGILEERYRNFGLTGLLLKLQ